MFPFFNDRLDNLFDARTLGDITEKCLRGPARGNNRFDGGGQFFRIASDAGDLGARLPQSYCHLLTEPLRCAGHQGHSSVEVYGT